MRTRAVRHSDNAGPLPGLLLITLRLKIIYYIPLIKQLIISVIDNYFRFRNIKTRDILVVLLMIQIKNRKYKEL